ncbi:MAG TPA: [FeFe] hydrogenase H-cluster maturation GTPase HydF [Mariniphaga sp.]|nr:[FeFe] hydrogenase H-cluster maturation GTPase HydF [Mariniphaga sp.]
MKSPKSFRLHIGIFGRRNTGKSSILNALTDQIVSIVSDVPGTTTDPVEKPMELLPIGPVLFIDTAGIDDEGELGLQRIARTHQIFERTDLAILVASFNGWSNYEWTLIDEFEKQDIPFLVVFNKIDISPVDTKVTPILNQRKISYTNASATLGMGIDEIKQLIIQKAPADFIDKPKIVADLVGPDEIAILVVPIDKEAPKGRLILPQVQSIRDLLDGNSICMVIKEHQIKETLHLLNKKPRLVVTDSQAFARVAADTPPDIPLTSFSILFARYQGDLNEMVKGAIAIDHLQAGDKVLIAEACTHHPVEEDIGTVKIPAWLNKYVGSPLNYNNHRGHDFPNNLNEYKLIIHCGACMWNRREMLSRILKARNAGVPITNYGLTIAWSLGIFQRALGPFPAALKVFTETR